MRTLSSMSGTQRNDAKSSKSAQKCLKTSKATSRGGGKGDRLVSEVKRCSQSSRSRARKSGVSKAIGRSPQGRLPTLAGGALLSSGPPSLTSPRPMIRDEGEELKSECWLTAVRAQLLRLVRNTRLLSNFASPLKTETLQASVWNGRTAPSCDRQTNR